MNTNHNQNCPCSLCYSLRGGGASSTSASTHLPETVSKDYTEKRLSIEEIEKAYPEAYKWAREFHDLYEETAPMFGYETKKETKEFDPTSPNGRLMAYVCFNVIQQALAEERERMVRVFAEYIYDQMPYDEVGTKPSWVVGGNSLKQEDARALAIKLISPLDKPLTDNK